MMKNIDLGNIRKSIQQMDVNEQGIEFIDVILRSDLLSLTEPLFFDELEKIVSQIKLNNIEGCFVEAGVWSGATAIFMKALIEKYDLNRNLWLLDSYGGAIDSSVFKKEKDILAIKKFLSWTDVKTPTLSDVINNFNRFDLLDDRVKMLKGDVFKTIDQFTETPIALFRLDLDFFESTYFMLQQLYDKVTPGGYIIIDDYNVEEFNCKDAVDLFRKERNITSKIIPVGNFLVYWIKE
jgi:O-methyltransferase